MKTKYNRKLLDVSLFYYFYLSGVILLLGTFFLTKIEKINFYDIFEALIFSRNFRFFEISFMDHMKFRNSRKCGY